MLFRSILLIVGNVAGGISGKAISQDKAADLVLNFVKAQAGEGAELVDVSSESGLYKVTVLFQGSQVPLYLTKDGKNLVQGVLPLTLLDLQPKPSESQPSTEDIPKTDKPKVELFIMAMCPYGTQVEKGIIPALEALGDKVDFNLRFVSYAMHGKNELDENTNLYCVQKEAPEKLYDYMKCYLGVNDPSKWESCISDVGISKSKIDACVSSTDSEFKITELFNDKSSWNGGKYPQYNVDKDLNTEYGVKGSPTLVINGQVISSARDSASYLDAICQAFNNAPEECGTKLSSDSPSPGFGYDTSGSSGSAGSCS